MSETLLLFSYAILPKDRHPVKEFPHNNDLHPKFSLTALSGLECYSGYMLSNMRPIDNIIILGCKTFGDGNPADSELMAEYMQQLGTPKDRITTTQDGPNTVYQVRQAQEMISSDSNVTALTLDVHKSRTEQLLRAYGISPKAISIEEVFRLYNMHGKHLIDAPTSKYMQTALEEYNGSQTKQRLAKEAKILETLQQVDPRGYSQMVLTTLLGVRYFDTDIPPTLAKSYTS